jgi:hypothetical protein
MFFLCELLGIRLRRRAGSSADLASNPARGSGRTFASVAVDLRRRRHASM